jgi:methionyl aminopeptidase
VFTIEPFLSLGADWAMDSSRDQWTLLAQPSAPTVQYEQTMVAMPRGAVVAMPLTGLEALL